MPHGSEFEGDNGFKTKTEEAVSKSAMDKMLHEVLTNGPALQRPAWMGQAAQEALPAVKPQAAEHAMVDVEKNEALTNERASEDVFKAIFGDDDDDDE
jgi:G patch domain-containing protein 1